MQIGRTSNTDVFTLTLSIFVSLHFDLVLSIFIESSTSIFPIFSSSLTHKRKYFFCWFVTLFTTETQHYLVHFFPTKISIPCLRRFILVTWWWLHLSTLCELLKYQLMRNSDLTIDFLFSRKKYVVWASHFRKKMTNNNNDNNKTNNFSKSRSQPFVPLLVYTLVSLNSLKKLIYFLWLITSFKKWNCRWTQIIYIIDNP